MPEILQVIGGGSLLHLVVRDVTTHLDRQFESFGLTTQQAALLLSAASGGSSPSQLLSVVGTDTAGMTKLLDRLEAKGLIERSPNPDDRRSVLIEPTERGLTLVPDLRPVFGRVASKLFDGFSAEEIASFNSSLRRMRENLQS